MQELYRRNIDAFFDHVSTFRDGYRHSGLSYLAIKKEGNFVLSQGRVFLHNAPPTLPLTHFTSENVRAGYYTLTDLGLDIEQLKNQLISGAISTPHGTLLFPPEDEKGHQSTYLPFHHEGLKAQNRLNVLMIFGNAQDKYDASAYLDWELMAASTPYSSVTELMFEYRLGPSLLDRRNIEFIAFNVTGFDTSSRISGAKANIVVNLAKGLEVKNIRVGYRVFSQNQVASRGNLIGTQLEWQETDLFQQGTTSLKVAEASVVHGFLSYAGVAQQHFWIADPELSQNSRRVTYEIFDNKMSQLKDFLQSQGKGRNARDLEASVSWLLWMLGFHVINLGCVDKMSDGPDIIATTPSGHFAVIECTTGLLKTENKLPNLIDRTEAVRRRLDASNNRHLKVMSVMVSSKTRDEIRADLEQAQKLGILVLTREDLLQLADVRTLIFPNTDALYEEAEQTIRASQEQYQLALQSNPTANFGVA